MTTPIVSTASGAVEGFTASGVHTFRGVPFARAPVGPDRFSAPSRPDPWDRVRSATAFGPTAPQPLVTVPIPQIIIEGDAFLHVNVHTPEIGSAGLPVLVWIHGGGMVQGSNADPWTQGEGLARRGIVVVSMNYRLGVEGFLPLEDAPHNRGVLDWIAGLEWVQENVAAFGGDPARVTVGGHSAGSAAVLTLMTLPEASGTFERVLAMSGVPWNLPYLDESIATGKELAARLDVPRTREGLASKPLDEVLAVQAELAPVAGIKGFPPPLEAFHQMTGFRQTLGPAVDGGLVPVSPVDAIRDGAGASRALMIGSTSEEADALISILGTNLDQNECRAALMEVGVDEASADRWFTTVDGATPAARLGAALTARNFRSPLLAVAEHRNQAAAKTFVYESSFRPPTPIGAVHGYDLPFFFDTLASEGAELLSGDDPPHDLRDEMVDALICFVETGDPGWDPYGKAGPISMAFDVPPRTRSDHDRLIQETFRTATPPRSPANT